MTADSIIQQNDPRRKAAEHVHQLLSGKPASPVAPTELGEYVSIIEGVNVAYRLGGVGAAREAFEAMCRKDEALRTLLLEQITSDEQSTRQAQVEEPQHPALPDDIIPNVPDDAAGSWLDTYTAYASAKSPMTPLIFHESAGLGLVAIAVARRLRLKMSYDDVYPNLYIAWIADTTVFFKSTGLNIARSLAAQAFPHLVAPQESSPEALLSDMAGVQPSNFGSGDQNPQILELWREERNYAAQRGWIQDEMSGLLASSGKDYNAGLLEFFLKAYDCEPRYVRSTKKNGRIEVRNIYATFIGASTPAALCCYLRDQKLWSNGWWPRFALLTPEVDMPEWRPPTGEILEPSALREGLDNLYRSLPPASWPNPPTALDVTLGTGVFPAWERYCRALRHDMLAEDNLDDTLRGTYGRLPTQVLKNAILLAAMDWQGGSSAPHIELPHLAKAMRIAEVWRASAHRTIDKATRSRYGQARLRLLKVLGRFQPNGASLRDIQRYIKNMDPTEIIGVLMQMKLADEVEEVQAHVGRPTVRFRLISA